MYIIDTSVYCSIFLEDVHAEEAIDMISSISEKIYVPHMIFAETLTVLTYKYSKERAGEFYDYILSDDRFILFHQNFFEDIYFWKKIDKKISYIDIVTVRMAVDMKLKLLSFDEDMLRLHKEYT